MMPQASLPMYNLPEMQADNAAFWLAIRTEAEQLGVTGLPRDLDFARRPVPDAHRAGNGLHPGLRLAVAHDLRRPGDDPGRAGL